MEAILPVFQREARRHARLQHEEEGALVRLFRASGDREAGDRLLRGHLRSVVAMAVRYRRYGVPLGELVAEGAFGMVQALNKFDESRGVRFSTYANHWIRAYVLDHVIRSWSLVGGGSGALRSRHFFRVRRERARVRALLGDGEAADMALARRLAMTVEQARDMVGQLEARDVSLNAPAHATTTSPLVDLLVANSDFERDFLRHEQHQQLTISVRAAIATLDVRERFIAEQRLMADSTEELSLAEISRKLGISRERARQLETRTKRKLRGHLQALQCEAAD